MLSAGGTRNTTSHRSIAATNREDNEDRITDKSHCNKHALHCPETHLKYSMNHCVPNWDSENGIMPSPDFLPMTKSNWDTAQQKRSLMPAEHEIEELLWENGPVVNKVIKRPLSSQFSKSLQNDDAVLPGKPSLAGKDNVLDSVVHDMAATSASSIQEDEMASWLHYPLDDSLEKEYCSDFFGGMPSTNVHLLRDSIGAQVNHAPAEKVSSVQAQKGSSLPNDCNSVSWTGGFGGMVSAANTAGSSNIGKDSGPKSVGSDKAMALGAGRASGLIPQSCSDTFARVRTAAQLPLSKWHANVEPSSSSEGNQSSCQKTNTQSVSPLAMPPPKMQAIDAGPMKLSSRSRVVNFSHFSRPAATVKANLQNIGSVSGLSTIGISNRVEKLRECGGAPAEPSIIESTISDMTAITSSTATISQVQDVGYCHTRQNPQLMRSSDLATCSEDVTTSSGKAPEQLVSEISNVAKSLASGGPEKCGEVGDVQEPTITSSSGGSGNSAGRTGKEPANTSKRKGRDAEESECQSEDVEYESVDAKKQAPPRTTSKRSRAAEVHNQSERRRRDRINEKMRALQELIPHCNKSDKASMLDEAIEYLKTLQLQVQIMSMGGGMGISPMVFPGGMQHFQVPQMAHLSHMGMGMGMGYSMGMLDMGAASVRPVMPLPPMHASALPASTIHCPAAMPGSSLPIPRIPGTGLQVSGLPVSTLPQSGFSGTAQPASGSTSANSTDLQEQLQSANVIDPYKFYLSRPQMQLSSQAMNGNLYNVPMTQSAPQNPTQSSGRGLSNMEPGTGNAGTAG